jgi:hypothetical protein
MGAQQRLCMGNGEIGLCCVAIYFSPMRHFLRVLQEDEALYVANITLSRGFL